MTWDNIQQIIRIMLYAIGGYFLGDGVVEGEAFQAAVGGLLAFLSFVWWLFWNSWRKDAVPW